MASGGCGGHQGIDRHKFQPLATVVHRHCDILRFSYYKRIVREGRRAVANVPSWATGRAPARNPIHPRPVDSASTCIVLEGRRALANATSLAAGRAQASIPSYPPPVAGAPTPHVCCRTKGAFCAPPSISYTIHGTWYATKRLHHRVSTRLNRPTVLLNVRASHSTPSMTKQPKRYLYIFELCGHSVRCMRLAARIRPGVKMRQGGEHVCSNSLMPLAYPTSAVTIGCVSSPANGSYDDIIK